MIKKYVLKKEGTNLYSSIGLSLETNRSPVLLVENDTLKFLNKKFQLNGMTLNDWLIENKEKLKHNISSSGKNGSQEIITYSDKMVLEEVPLGDYEDFYISYQKSEQDYKKDIQQFTNILRDLENIFQYVEPDTQNNKTYGLSLRDLIIKTCTEVETHWKELMRLNGYDKSNLSTNDYVKLLEFIDFNHEVKLIDYPLYPTLKPFEKWNKTSPTKTINWYQTYHDLKHDRTNSLSKANFSMLINSISALYIIMEIRYNLGQKSSNMNLISIFKNLKSVKGSKWKLNTIHTSSFIKLKHIKYFEYKTSANTKI